MSRFYARGSDSESESSSSESDPEPTIKKPIIAATAYDDVSFLYDKNGTGPRDLNYRRRILSHMF